MRYPTRVLALAVATGLAITAGAVAAQSGAPRSAHAPTVVAGPPGGLVPARDDIGAARVSGTPGVKQLTYHNGPVVTAPMTVTPINWAGSATGATGVSSDVVDGMSRLYAGIGQQNYLSGPSYIATNGEYWSGSSTSRTPVNLTVSAGTWATSTSALPSGAPSTSQVLSAVVNAVGASNLRNGGYYPVYSPLKRGTAGYCAWHSYGTVSTGSSTVRITFGFFFDLAGDSGCSSGASTPTSAAVANLGNVSGHELSEVLTDPYLNAWYDTQGAENSDKCAWNFGSAVTIGTEQWKIQKNWSNAASGCIQTR